MTNCCVYSSLLFITNVILGYKLKYYIYSLLFLILLFASIMYHSYGNIYTEILDKLCILLVAIYGLNCYYNKCKLNNDKILYKILVIVSLISIIILYYYGHTCDKYCFDKDYGYQYHSLLHLISSIGNNLIILI